MLAHKNYQATLGAIRRSMDKTILDISRIQSYFNGIEDLDGLGDLEFIFTDNSLLSLTGMGNAESVEATNSLVRLPETFNVSNNDICSWKRLNIKNDQTWKKIIGQTIQSAEVIWKYKEYPIAFILRFHSDFLLFYETESDATHFLFNERPTWVDLKTEIEILS